VDSTADIEIGQEIRQRREALGLTRESLAHLAQLSYKTIERIEAGGVMPRRATLTVIEQAFTQAERELEAA
jgi:predicted transcriptional regulator